MIIKKNKTPKTWSENSYNTLLLLHILPQMYANYKNSINIAHIPSFTYSVDNIFDIRKANNTKYINP